MANCLDLHAQAQGTKRVFVLISSAKPPPFLNEYTETKFEAEKYLAKECENLEAFIIRPGFIWSTEYRWWSIPLQIIIEPLFQFNHRILRCMSATDFLFPAETVRLETVGYYAAMAAMKKI